MCGGEKLGVAGPASVTQTNNLIKLLLLPIVDILFDVDVPPLSIGVRPSLCLTTPCLIGFSLSPAVLLATFVALPILIPVTYYHPVTLIV